MTKSHKRKILIMNGGGLAPALNAFYAEFTKQAENLGYDEIWGVRESTDGLASIYPKFRKLTSEVVEDWTFVSGSKFGTANSSINPADDPVRLQRLIENILNNEFTDVVVMGGDGTPREIEKIIRAANGQLSNINICYVGKTIDGGIVHTDNLLGFKSAVYHVGRAVRGLMGQATMRRMMFAEVMGRDAPYLLMNAAAQCPGITGLILSKRKYDLRSFAAKLCIQAALGRQLGGLVAVAEGALKPSGENGSNGKATDNTNLFGGIVHTISLAFASELKRFAYFTGGNETEIVYKTRDNVLTHAQQTCEVIERDVRLAAKLATTVLSDMYNNQHNRLFYMERYGEVAGTPIEEIIPQFEAANSLGGYVNADDTKSLRYQGVLLGNEGPLLAAYRAAVGNEYLRQHINRFANEHAPRFNLDRIERDYLENWEVPGTEEWMQLNEIFYTHLQKLDVEAIAFPSPRQRLAATTTTVTLTTDPANDNAVSAPKQPAAPVIIG